MALTLRMLNGRNPGRVFRISGQAPRELGRDVSKYIVDDRKASRRHAEVRLDDETWSIRDLGSTNGTFVNGQAIQGSVDLSAGDRIQIGRVMLMVVQALPFGVLNPNAAADTQLGPAPALELEAALPDEPAALELEDDPDLAADPALEAIPALDAHDEFDAALEEAAPVSMEFMEANRSDQAEGFDAPEEPIEQPAEPEVLGDEAVELTVEPVLEGSSESAEELPEVEAAADAIADETIAPEASDDVAMDDEPVEAFSIEAEQGPAAPDADADATEKPAEAVAEEATPSDGSEPAPEAETEAEAESEVEAEIEAESSKPSIAAGDDALEQIEAELDELREERDLILGTSPIEADARQEEPTEAEAQAPVEPEGSTQDDEHSAPTPLLQTELDSQDTPRSQGPLKFGLGMAAVLLIGFGLVAFNQGWLGGTEVTGPTTSIAPAETMASRSPEPSTLARAPEQPTLAVPTQVAPAPVPDANPEVAPAPPVLSPPEAEAAPAPAPAFATTPEPLDDGLFDEGIRLIDDQHAMSRSALPAPRPSTEPTTPAPSPAPAVAASLGPAAKPVAPTQTPAAPPVDEPAAVAAAVTPDVEVSPPVTPAGPGETLVILVDASGSMIDSLPAAMAYAAAAIDRLRPQDRFTVLFFREHQYTELLPVGLKPADVVTRLRYRRVLRPDNGAVLPAGKSDVSVALTKALEYEPSQLLIISDNAFGRVHANTTGDDVLESFEQAMAENPVRIDTVQCFYRDPERVLERLSERHHGQHLLLRTRADINETPIGDDALQQLLR